MAGCFLHIAHDRQKLLIKLYTLMYSRKFDDARFQKESLKTDFRK